jgi:hypothetical protein
MSDHSELQGYQHLSVTVLLLIMMSIKIMLFWCSLSPRRTKLIILTEQKTLVKQIMTFCFFNGVEIHGTQYFHEKDDRNVVSGKDSA